jgi:hypothetical protein
MSAPPTDSRFKKTEVGRQSRDSRFKIPDSRFQIQDSRFQIQDSRFKQQKGLARSLPLTGL